MVSLTADIVDRLTREGLVPLLDAARANGVKHISIFALHRACMSGALESVKCAGKRMTTPEAFKRWLVARSQLPERQRQPRQSRRTSRPQTSAATRAYLASKGLRVGGSGEP